MPSYFAIGQRELKGTNDDLSVPVKAKVALVIFHREIELLEKTIKYAGVGVIVILLTPLIPLPILAAAFNALAAVAFVGWYLSAKRKLKSLHRQLISDLGRLTQHSRIRLFDQETVDNP